MLTIRFKAWDGGEFVREISSLHYLPPTNLEERDRLTVKYADGEYSDLYEGTAYVMNENGKTVADYHLSAPPVVPPLRAELPK